MNLRRGNGGISRTRTDGLLIPNQVRFLLRYYSIYLFRGMLRVFGFARFPEPFVLAQGWSIQRDSNPPYLLGRQRCCHYTMDACCRFLSIFVDGIKNSQNSFLSWLPLFSYASLPISLRISRIFSRSSRVSALASISSSSCFSFSMHSCKETFISRLLSGLRVVL